jgi:hypothetical protein
VKRLVALSLAGLFLASCARREPPSSSKAAVENKLLDDAAERLSLLDLAHGATVVERTGEATLEVSALRAIDGEPSSSWMSPPHDLPQSMVIAVPARSRIEKVGIRTIARGAFTANHVTFETSIDGRTFTRAITIKSADSSDPQWFDIKPAEAAYVRVTMVDSLLPGHDVLLNSALARGSELEPPHPGDITGCWSINGQQARFARRGAHVIGILESGKEPMRFDGGFDGRIYRLNWIRGNDYGMTLLTVAADGRHLSAMSWHEEAIPMFFDTSWFGEKLQCSTSIADSGEVAIALLHRTGRFSLYDRADLPRLLRESANVQFVAHEFRFPTAQQNRDASEQEIAALRQQLQSAGVDLSRITFVAKGSDAPRQQPVTEAMRALYSTIDLEIRR